LCGYALDERLGTTSGEYEDWLRYVMNRLDIDAEDQPGMNELLKKLHGSSSEAAAMRFVLHRRFLSNAEGRPNSTLVGQEDDMARFLTTEGALKYDTVEAKYTVRLFFLPTTSTQ